MRVYLAQPDETEWQTLIFEGNVDNRLSEQIPEILDFMQDHTIFDLDKVKSIDHAGIEVWCELMQSIDPDISLCLVNCPSHFIDKANLIPQLIGKACVLSIYIPVKCSECKKQFEFLYENKDLVSTYEEKEVQEFIDQKKCSSCNSPNLKTLIDLKLLVGAVNNQ